MHVNGTTIEMVAKEKDLGITITKDLTWNNHLKAIVSKANRKMGFIKRNCFALLNTKTLILLHTSLVRSYFCYASQVWAPQSIIQDPMLVENTQRRATKFICKSDTFSYKDRLLRLRLLPLNYWLEYLDLVFFFKCKCGDINLNIHNYIQYCKSKSRRGSSGIRELTNRRLSHDDAVRLRDVTSAHAYMGTCQSRAKVDDVGESDLQASRK